MKLVPVDPQYIAFDVTYRCNADCHFCFLRNNSLLNKKSKELNYLEIKGFINKLGNLKRKFYLTGGEPLLRTDLLDIIGYLKSKGHSCTLTTNGILLNERIIYCLLKYKIDEIVISLHGNCDIHEKTLNVKGSFQKIVKNILKINSSNQRWKGRLIIWCTINKYNFYNLYEIYNLFLSLNPDRIAFNHLEFIDSRSLSKISALWEKYLGHSLELKPSLELVKKIDTGVLTREIYKIKNMGRQDVSFYPDLSPSEIAKWYNPEITLKENNVCYGQWKSLWISPSGDVISCQPIAEKFGNIKDRFYSEIYNGEKYNCFRNLLEKLGGLFPACARCGRVPYQTKNIYLD